MGTTSIATRPTVYSSALPINTVRAYEGASTVAEHVFDVYDADSKKDTRARVTLSKGRASSGYRSDYERLEVWWTELAVLAHLRPSLQRPEGRA